MPNSTTLARVLILVAGVYGSVDTASAQDVRVEGVYKSPSISVQVLLLDYENSVSAIALSLSQGRCSGEFTGIGVVSQKKLTAVPFLKLDPTDACVVSIDFSQNFSTIKLSDNGNCWRRHGASCSWDGLVAKKIWRK